MNEMIANGPSEQHPCKQVPYSDARGCQAECDVDARCVAWTHHFTSAGRKGPATWRCCHRTAWTNLTHAKGCTSGIKSPPGVSLKMDDTTDWGEVLSVSAEELSTIPDPALRTRFVTALNQTTQLRAALSASSMVDSKLLAGIERKG